MGRRTKDSTFLTTAKQNSKSIRKRETKKDQSLSHPDIRRWYENLGRSSKNTAEVRLRKMRHFCEIIQMTPMELIEIGKKDQKQVTDLIQDHISWMDQNGKAPQYIKATVTAVKSWLEHFDIKLSRKIKIANTNATPTLQDERVPDGAELAELTNRGTLRAGASIALIAKAGLRPEVLGNVDASDGLMIKDLPDLQIVNGWAAFVNKPAKVIVRSSLSKARHEYFTFLTDLGAKRVLTYLNERIANGEVLEPNSPVIAPFAAYERFRGVNEGKRFVETPTITREIRKCMRPRFDWRPYVLRAFFDTQLLIAESRGKIANDFRVFFMGHAGSIEAKYTTNKAKLPEALIKEMRDSFERSQEFLDLEKTNIDPLEKSKKEVQASLNQLLESAKTPEELAKVQMLISQLVSCKTKASDNA